MSRYEHGRILAVNEKQLGSELVAAHTAGAMSLTVEDPVDFDEDGGHLMIADQVIEYSTYDDDTGEITLLSALAADATNSESVWLYDALFQTVTTELLAEVELDGDDDNTDALECVIAHHLVDMVPEGIRGLRGESVLLEQDGDEWRIVDVLGLTDRTTLGDQFKQERFTLPTAGAQSLQLMYTPKTDSDHVIHNGLTLPQDEYTITGRVLTLKDPDACLLASDLIDVKYAYRLGITTAAPLHVRIGDLWKYATGLGSSTTYAAPGFDDSSWAQAPSPFGWDDTGTNPNNLATFVPSPMDVWTRLTIETNGGDLTFSTPFVDDNASVYLDGTLIWSPAFPSRNASITVAAAAGTHVVAIHGTDLGDTATVGEGAYSGFDIQEGE